MKKRLSKLFTLSFVTALTSCASQDFHQYTGVQQNWPTASGTFVSTRYGVPAYYGPPNRPYIVLGSLDATTVRGIGQDAESAVQDAARVAKRMGADAIIVIGSAENRSERVHSEPRLPTAATQAALMGPHLATVFTGAPTEAARPLQICLVRPLAPIKGRRQRWSLNLSSSSAHGYRRFEITMKTVLK